MIRKTNLMLYNAKVLLTGAILCAISGGVLEWYGGRSSGGGSLHAFGIFLLWVSAALLLFAVVALGIGAIQVRLNKQSSSSFMVPNRSSLSPKQGVIIAGIGVLLALFAKSLSVSQMQSDPSGLSATVVTVPLWLGAIGCLAYGIITLLISFIFKLFKAGKS